MGQLKQIWQSKDGLDVITTSYVVHTFRISDAEDPDIYAAEPIWEWQQSEPGKWIMENAIQKPSWHRHLDMNTYGYMYQIRADLTDAQITYWKLKYE